jgi:arylsulfatase A-like enzyme
MERHNGQHRLSRLGSPSDSDGPSVRLVLATLFVAVFIAGAVVGCSSEAPEETRPLSGVLITVDTLRSDRLGAYGYAAARTPAIDEFAAEGAPFENVYCDIPWTTASMASIMTGRFSTEHGLQEPWLRLPEGQLTVAEVFRDHGYNTSAVVGIFSLDSVYGLDQGFDSYDDDFSLPAVVLQDRSPDTKIDLKISDDLTEYSRLAEAKLHNDAYKEDGAVTDSALAWLAANKDEPFFLWVHYFGPHERLIFTEGSRDNKSRMVAEYDRDLAGTDRALGRLLKGIDHFGLRSNTLVVLSADHGKSLGERGSVGHGRNVYEPEVRIPLLVRLPGRVNAGMRAPQVMRSVDIFPTLLDYAGIETPNRIAGRSVRSVIDGNELTDRLAFMDLNVVTPTLLDDESGDHLFGGVRFQALRNGRWKLVKGELAPACWIGGGKVIWDFLKLDPKGREGATRLADDECAGHGFTSLFDVRQAGPAFASENVDVASRRPALVKEMDAMLSELAANTGEAESFQLTPEQEQKLKSLGYLR